MNVLDATWLASSIVAAAPLLLAASGELVSQRAGVLNIGLEAYILAGAFFGYWAEVATGSLWIGVVCGVGAGLLLAAGMGIASIQCGADQLVVGIGMVLLATGATSYIFDVKFGGTSTVSLKPMESVSVPVVSDIPFLGRPLFDQSVLVYVSYLAVPLAAFVLYRTTWGLAVRASGEAPVAAVANGLKVRALRWQALLLSGAMGGLAGAFLSVAQLGFFVHGMSSGRGYLALAAIFFGQWRAKGAFLACLIFGAAQSLQLRLQGLPSVPRSVWIVFAIAILAHLIYSHLSRDELFRIAHLLEAVVAIVVAACGILSPDITLPSELWLALPYVLSLIVLGLSVGTSRMPSGLTLSPRPT